jgi:hypothetical protein
MVATQLATLREATTVQAETSSKVLSALKYVETAGTLASTNAMTETTSAEMGKVLRS